MEIGLDHQVNPPAQQILKILHERDVVQQAARLINRNKQAGLNRNERRRPKAAASSSSRITSLVLPSSSCTSFGRSQRVRFASASPTRAVAASQRYSLACMMSRIKVEAGKCAYI
jgi:hypothetical protein